MKKLFIAILLLLSNFAFAQNITTSGQRQFPGPTRTYGDIYSNDQGIEKRVITETTANLTLYVTTTGNDSDNCLTTATACLTIQGAVNKTPKHIKHKVIINVGAGNFGGFYITGFTFEPLGSIASYSFIIQGADYINVTPATGTGSGTFTAGDTRNGTDAGQTWTAHDLRGKIVYVNSSYFFIRDNTDTALELVGPSSSTLNGKAYVIKDMSTIITSNTTIPGGTACINISANVGARPVYAGLSLNKLKIVPPAGSTYGIFSTESPLALSFVSVFSPASTYGVYNISSLNVRYSDVFTSGGAYGIYLGFHNYVRGIERICAYGASSSNWYLVSCNFGTSANIYADGGGATGFRAQQSGFNPISYLYAKNNVGAGVQILNMTVFTFTNGVIDSNGDNFIINAASPVTVDNVPYGATAAYIQTVVISNSTRNGIAAAGNVLVRTIGVTGTGNGNYGIYAKYGAHFLIESTTTITGTSGDVKIGATVGSYAVDFAVDESYITDISDGTLMKRIVAMTF